MSGLQGAQQTINWHDQSLSVLVPAFNEVGNLQPTIDRLIRALNISVEDFEIIVVDDGSSDGTAAVADRLPLRHPQVRVIHNATNRGLGYCYQQGIRAAQKDSFVYIPGDNTWPFRSFLELFGNLGKADIVTSYSTNPEVRPFGRRIVSRSFTRVLNFIFGRQLRYYNGLTIYPLAYLRSQIIRTTGFGFQAETLLRAVESGLSVVEVALPIDERTAGGSKAVSVKNVASVLRTVARMCWELRVARRDRLRSERAIRASGAAAKRHIILTGATSGIGAALAEALAADGHTVYVCARRADALERIASSSPSILAHVCDVSEEEQVEAFVGWVGERTNHVDALINCAGSFGAIGPFEVTDSAEWLNTLRVNLYGTYLVTKHALALLGRSMDARVVNFSGGGAFGAFPNYSAYACSKAGIVRLTECLAAELAPRGVAVNAVAPGFLATPAHDSTLRAGPALAGALHYRRTLEILEESGAEMDNVLDCVRFLLSYEARGLSGKTISANFDPWRTTAFRQRIVDASRSDLWTMRRLNIVNLPDGSLKSDLGEAWASYGTRS
ncbi:MAG: SDR family oxidoreductase [Chloroflexi bacterium]|nr:SDR family oxidoreductase [Chloroflexota bacterium]MBV9598747.1 SDR family oxidoreductase [Chloroflexota bacterium]